MQPMHRLGIPHMPRLVHTLHATFFFRNNNQMRMDGHEEPGQDIHVVFLDVCAEQITGEVTVVIGKRDLATAVVALGEMMGDTSKYGSCESRPSKREPTAFQKGSVLFSGLSDRRSHPVEVAWSAISYWRS